MWRIGIAVVGAATLALSGTALAASAQEISVNGTGGASVPDGATNGQQQAAYDQALNAAIGDAQTKAQLVAQQLALPLGPVQSFTEQSDDYLGDCGVGFLPVVLPGVSGRASAPASAGVANGNLTPIPPKRRKHKAKRKAHKAQSSENTCQLEADVTVVYTTT